MTGERNTLLGHCVLCPRKCSVNREQTPGFCRGGVLPRVAHAGLHHWEEPCLSGTRGSGAVFFSGCTLRCCFCQNQKISAGNLGREITVPQLARIFLNLQEQGAHNLNLVTATHYLPPVLDALDLVKEQLHIPVVYNTSGYETVETLELLKGYVDIFLPDFKYADSQWAGRFSGAPDYPDVAKKSVRKMVELAGPPVFGKDGLLKSGVIVRHLALPSLRADTFAILEWIKENVADQVLISVMCQYTPMGIQEYKPLNRRLSTYEYQLILDKMEKLGLENGYVQQRESAGTEYIPPFDPDSLPI